MADMLSLACWGFDGWAGHMGWGGAWWMLVWGTAMMLGGAALIVWLVRSTKTPPDQRGETSDPLDSAREILAQRYARGELTTEEFRERQEQLG